MSLKTFSTPFTENLLGMLLISANSGTGFTLSDPGTYTLSSIVDWYHATSDGLALGSMTAVVAGVDVVITVTDTPVTWYCKIEHVGDQAPLTFRYDQPSPGASLSGVTGVTNTSLGTAAADSLTSGARTTAVGVNAGTAITSGTDNVAVGADALDTCTSGSANTAVGSGAGNTGSSNTCIGYHAGTDGTGSENVIIGRDAGYQMSDGTKNALVGRLAGDELFSGSGNVAIGYRAGRDQGDVSNKFMVGLGNGQGLIFEVDEVGNLLNIRVRYTDGTMKDIAGLGLA
jgi:hypothetical protein